MTFSAKFCVITTAFLAFACVGFASDAQAGNSWGWAKPLNQKPGSLLYTSNRKNRRLVIVSDLMQHSDGFSFYRYGADLAAYSEASVAQQVPKMSGVDVVARIVPRQEYDLPIGELRAFWRAYFDKTGASSGSTN